MKLSTAQLILCMLGSLTLAACGGGGSDTSAPQQTQVAPPTGNSGGGTDNGDDGSDDGSDDGGEDNTDPEPTGTALWTFTVHDEPVAISVGGEYGSFIGDYHVEDFDYDGRVDILLGGPSWDNTEGSDGWSGRPAMFEVLWGTENGFENDPARLFGADFEPTMIQLVDIMVSDYDGNGVNDFVMAGSGLDAFEGNGDHLEYYRNIGQLPLVRSDEMLGFEQAAFVHAATKGDFNGDGFEDVSAWQCCVSPTVEYQDSAGIVLMNNGAGDFTHDPDFVPEEFAPEYVQERFQEGSWQILEAQALDLNGSTCDDLIVGGNGAPNYTQILWNHCNGTLSTPKADPNDQSESYVLPMVDGYDIVLSVEPIHINNDDEIDLLVSRTDSEYEGSYIQILTNNGDLTFTDESDRYIEQPADETAIGQAYIEDFDGDGYTDIVFAHAMYRGTAEGLVQVDVDINSIYDMFIVVDIDGNGKTDVLLRHVVPETFGWPDQTIEYTLFENVSE